MKASNAAEKKILLTDVNQFISCVLCKGYLIDATTITECLHTFCKKCIVEYLEENTTCPTCDKELHQSHPLLYIAHDRTLQSIVYKLVANLERGELERQVKFYDERQLDYPSQLKEKLEQFNLLNKTNQIGKAAGAASEEKHSVESSSTTSSNSSSAANKENTHSDYHRYDEQIPLSLEPLDGLSDLKRRYVLCSCHATITNVKKFVAHNIYSNLEQYKELDILCNDDELLGKDHTLKFIYVTKWKNKDLPMRLFYRPRLDYFR